MNTATPNVQQWQRDAAEALNNSYDLGFSDEGLEDVAAKIAEFTPAPASAAPDVEQGILEAATSSTIRAYEVRSSPAQNAARELRPLCLSIGELAGAHERLRAFLMEGEPWPLTDVLTKLIEAGKILMHEKNYDGHGWEQISTAIERGEAALTRYRQSTRITGTAPDGKGVTT